MPRLSRCYKIRCLVNRWHDIHERLSFSFFQGNPQFAKLGGIKASVEGIGNLVSKSAKVQQDVHKTW